MKKFSVLLPLLILTGCQWVLTHPSEDAEALGVIEEAGKDIYDYESKTLSPAPPVNQDIWHKDLPVAPPMKPGV